MIPHLPARLGIIGDVHAEDDFLELALSHLRREGVETILATGDIADGTGSVDRCCSLLRDAGAVVVAGNHDRWLLESRMRDLSDATFLKHLSEDTIEFLRALPVACELDTRHGRLLLCHGLGANDMASVGPDDFGYALDSNLDLQGLIKAEHLRFVVNGHTHRRMVRAFGALTIINAGTLKQDHEPGFLILDVVENEVLELTMRADGSVNAPQTLAQLTAA